MTDTVKISIDKGANARRSRAQRRLKQRSNKQKKQKPNRRGRGKRMVVKRRANIYNSFAQNLKAYCDAVVNPFGQGAVGAILPDSYVDQVCAATDRFEMSLTPNFFNYLATVPWQDTDHVRLIGVAIWLQPRCNATGMLAHATHTGTGEKYNLFPFYPLNDTLDELSLDTCFNAYNLCITGIWTNSTGGTAPPADWGVYTDNGGAPDVVSMYYMIPFKKFEAIAENTTKMRLLGAGLKVWSEESPLNTGGYTTGGWLPLDDLFDGMYCSNATATDPGFFHTVEPRIRYPQRSQGVQGVTIRYSSLQDQCQRSLEYARIPTRLSKYVENTTGPKTSPYYFSPESDTIDYSTSDLIEAGSDIPFLVWNFNASEPTDVYALKIHAIAHVEATPNGSNPFASSLIKSDPAATVARQMVEDPAVWPPATIGHSFKSFATKLNRVESQVQKTASTIMQIMDVVERSSAFV